jgi:hypothetical protein
VASEGGCTDTAPEEGEVKSDNVELAKAMLLSLSSAELARIDVEMIRKIVLLHEDMASSHGLDDLDSEAKVDVVIGEIDADLDNLFRGETDDDR